MTKEDNKRVYIMVPRKLIITWIVSTIVLILLFLTSFQYANYVDRKSNRYWCGIIKLFNDTYEKEPPNTQAGKVLADEFLRLYGKFECSP